MKRTIVALAVVLLFLALGQAAWAQQGEVKIHYRWNNQYTVSMPDKTLRPVFGFAAQRLGITLKDVANPVATNDGQEFQLQAAEQFSAADIYGCSSIAEYFYQYGNEGAFVDLVPLMKAGKLPHFKKFMDGHPEIYAALLTPEGKLYHMPYLPDGGVARVYYLRTDWLKKFGLKTPTTTEELEKVLLAFLEKDANGNGLRDEIPYFNDKFREGLRLLNLWGARVYGNDNYGVRVVADQKGGKMYHAWIDPKFKAAVKEMARWYKLGLVDAQLFTRKENTARKELWTKLNVGGMTHEWVASTGNYNIDKDLLAKAPDFRIEVIAPVAAWGKGAYEEHARMPIKPDGWALSAKAKNRDAALAFMDWFWSEEGRFTTNFGVKGQTWDVLGPNGHPVFKPEVLAESAKSGGMNRYLWEKQGAQAPIGYWQDYEYERPWTPELAQKGVVLYSSGAVTYAYQTPVLTFTKAETEVVSEITDVLNAYLEESVINMITGKIDIETGWAAYVQKVRDLGSDRLVAAWQSAYDRYLKSAK